MKKLSILGIVALSIFSACSTVPEIDMDAVFINLVQGTWYASVNPRSTFNVWFSVYTTFTPKLGQSIVVDDNGDFTVQGNTSGESMIFTFEGVNKTGMGYYQLSGNDIKDGRSWTGMASSEDLTSLLMGDGVATEKNLLKQEELFPGGMMYPFLSKSQSSKINNEKVKENIFRSLNQ